MRSFKIGSGAISDEFLTKDPPSAAEIRALRDYIGDFFEGVEVDHPAQAVAVGGSATSLRTLVGAVLEYETLERAVRVLASDPIADVARRFELDPRRVRILPAGVLLLGEALGTARAAASDRQGRPARGRHSRSAQQRRQQRGADHARRVASTDVVEGAVDSRAR